MLLLLRELGLKVFLQLCVSQCSGAVAASLLLRLLFPSNAALGATVPAGSQAQSFVLEMILTALLMFVILNVSTGAKEKGITAGIAVGAVIGLEALFAGPICGASMNPARSFGPALVSGHASALWIYLVAPITGALVAVFGLHLCARRRMLHSKRGRALRATALSLVAFRTTPRACARG